MEIVAAFSGKPKSIGVGAHGKLVLSSIGRSRITAPTINVRQKGLAGTVQADTRTQNGERLHGGRRKAVYMYPLEHYAAWEDQLGVRFHLGAFGENFTIIGENEREIHQGDIFSCGSLVLEATTFRVPCFRFNKSIHDRYGVEKMAQKMREGIRCGIYFRVNQIGHIPVDAFIERQTINLQNPTIGQMFRAFVSEIPDFIPDEYTPADYGRLAPYIEQAKLLA